MYERYRRDPASVDAAWHDFLVDYRPADAARAQDSPPARPATTETKSDAVPKAPEPATARVAPAESGRDGHVATVANQAVPAVVGDATASPLRGAAARVVANMTTSLTVPTATSVRAVPAKLMADNRVVINNHLRRARGGKISYTHLIGYAIVKALAHNPEMNTHFAEIDGRPTLVTPEHVNLGIAIDLVG